MAGLKKKCFISWRWVLLCIKLFWMLSKLSNEFISILFITFKKWIFMCTSTLKEGCLVLLTEVFLIYWSLLYKLLVVKMQWNLFPNKTPTKYLIPRKMIIFAHRKLSTKEIKKEFWIFSCRQQEKTQQGRYNNHL